MTMLPNPFADFDRALQEVINAPAKTLDELARNAEAALQQLPDPFKALDQIISEMNRMVEQLRPQ